MMIEKVRWGVLGAANIAVKKVIPAMQRGDCSRITAIASRDLKKAQATARQLEIPRAYGSYDELLADSDIEAVYIPLPNHLHVPWSIKAAEAGKHVLCEKPISLTMADAISLLETRDRTGMKIEEAFMLRTHPQWIGALERIRGGRIGEIRSLAGHFSYYNRDPQDIRNTVEYGGGGLLDIGCYLIFISRLIFADEPTRVIGLVAEDLEMGTDIVTSAILDFAAGQSIFTCSTQTVSFQRVQIFGTRGRLEVVVPFNAPPDRLCRVYVDDGSDLEGRGIEVLEFGPVDQYTIQGDLFSRSIREGTRPPISLEDSVRNMAVIDALFRSAKSARWEVPHASSH